MTQSEILNIFKKSGALLTGHFLLTSGLHSENYIQCAQVLQYPRYAEELCRELAEKFKKDKVSVVIGPALGGVIVSYEVARALRVKSLFTERDSSGKMNLRRNFAVTPDDRVLVVEDVVTTAGSVKEVIDLVVSTGAKVVGVGCLVDRTEMQPALAVPLKGLIKLNFRVYNKKECPLCKKGIPAIKPGSRK